MFHKEADFSQIDNNIYLGGSLCCLTHNQTLYQVGISASINLTEDLLNNSLHALSYLWLPTKPNLAPSQEQLTCGVGLIACVVKQNKKIYIHCDNGFSRAPTLLAAYYITTGQDVMAALDIIRQQRPAVYLTEAQLQGLFEFKETNNI